jgi:hypothetical protein
MSCVGIIVLIWFSAVKKCKVIDEPHVTRFHRGLESTLLGSEMEGVKGLGLSFGDGRDSVGSWGIRPTSKEVSAEIEDNLAVLIEEEGAILVREFFMSETRKGWLIQSRIVK